jgi:hypothetical protein
VQNTGEREREREREMEEMEKYGLIRCLDLLPLGRN